MSDNLLLQLILSLLGGLVGTIVGAVVGGYLSYKGAVNAAKKQIDYLYSQERENRQYAEKRQKETLRNALMVEIRENIDLLNGGDSDRKTSLSAEAWSVYKGNIAAFSGSVQEEHIKAYAEAKRYNSYLEQISAMHLHGMDNNLLFPLRDKQQELALSTCKSVLKKLSQE